MQIVDHEALTENTCFEALYKYRLCKLGAPTPVAGAGHLSGFCPHWLSRVPHDTMNCTPWVSVKQTTGNGVLAFSLLQSLKSNLVLHT